MGQQALLTLKDNIEIKSNAEHLTKQSSYQFLKSIIENTQKTSKEPLTAQHIQEYLSNYLNSIDQVTRKRRRSYQILQLQIAKEEKNESHQNTKECKLLQDEMQWVEEIEETVRNDITEIMSTQKLFKIRQNFRRLMLKLLKIDNLWIYIMHTNGRIEFHDFRNNFITDILEHDKSESIQRCVDKGYKQDNRNEVIQIFGLQYSSEEELSLYRWYISSVGQKYKIFCLWKNYHNEQPFLRKMPVKMAQKITNISLISTLEEETSIIQNYSKDLLDILELCIKQSEQNMCSAINQAFFNFQDLQKWLHSKNKEDTQDAITLRINAFQRLKYELLQRVRMYKKYVCEQNKIFMDFDEQAVIAFISSNISHRYSSNLQHLYQKRKLYIENIFKEDKLINNFMKKALQKKLKNNKLYELDFQTKARIKYDDQGRIIRLHVIVQQIENLSDHSSSNIYCSSSTKILSEQSEQTRGKQNKKKEHRHSDLVKNLEKQNPGIINEGWINLFIKETPISRTKTHVKNKAKNFILKRSYSLNRDAILLNSNKSSSQLDSQVGGINIQSTDLNLLKVDEQMLQSLVIRVFKRLDFFCSDSVNKQYFQNFLVEIHNGYQIHNNPFHNFTHGVNVMHTCYLLCTTPKIMQLLNPFKIFMIVFSGLCHDVGHTGFTNLFQIASGSKKAITYNDISPLENYHASQTFQILRKPQNNFLKDLTNEQVKQFRKSVISNILYTDIKQHFPLLKKFNNLTQDQIPKTQQFMTCLSGMIVHTSDFGGSAKQFQVCKQWSLKVNLQFSNQYKLEGQLGLPQTPFMKDLTNISILSKNEGGFLKVIVLPLYETLNNFNGTDYRIKRMLQFIQNNIRQWQRINTQSQKPKVNVEI